MANINLKTTDLDLYGLLEIAPNATAAEIKSAYRKKALTCHPDKNPDNPNAAKLFIQLSEVFTILSDEKARAAYDQTLKAKEAARARTKQLDAKRRKFKEDLERREQEAKERSEQANSKVKADNLSSKEALQREIERLKKEGSRKLQEEQELMREQIRREMQQCTSSGGIIGASSFIQVQPKFTLDAKPRLKVKWSSSSSTSYYDYDKLYKIFSQYGKISELVILKKKALVEFDHKEDAENAYKTENSRTDSDLKLEWLTQPAESTPPSSSSTTAASKTSNTSQPTSFTNSIPPKNISNNCTDFEQFEAMVLANLAKAAEAQKVNVENT